MHTQRTGTAACTGLKKTHFIYKRKIPFVPFPKVEAYKNETCHRRAGVYGRRGVTCVMANAGAKESTQTEKGGYGHEEPGLG